MWPFTKKKQTPEFTAALWTSRATELCKRIVKANGRIGRQVAKTVLAGQTVGPDAEEKISLEVLVFCIHVCDRLTRERYTTNVPSGFTKTLLERAGAIMTIDMRDINTASRVRGDIVNIYADREVMYQSYTQLRGERGQSDKGTLVEAFAKILTTIYSKNNALARTMLTAQGIEIVKTLPHYLDEVGMQAA